MTSTTSRVSLAIDGLSSNLPPHLVTFDIDNLQKKKTVFVTHSRIGDLSLRTLWPNGGHHRNQDWGVCDFTLSGELEQRYTHSEQ